MAEAGAPVANLQLLGDAPSHFHPGRSARLCLGAKTVLAAFGELHPATLRLLDIDGPVMAAEIFLDAIPPARDTGRARPAFQPPVQQAITRDFAFVVPLATPADTVARAVRGADKTAIVDVRLFDRFTGAGIGEGEQSLALEVTLQPRERSFTDAEIGEVSAKIVAAAGKIGGRLRG